MDRRVPAAEQAAPERIIPFDCVALLLQGGGALGSYQGGVYQALAEHGVHPDWVAGISIGAVNGAIIAGNEPAVRVEKLRDFWETVTAPAFQFPLGGFEVPWMWGHPPDALVGPLGATRALVSGAPEFFTPRFPPPYLHRPGGASATSFYDVSPLKKTLERLVDFDRINAKKTRYSAGAVNVASGNFVYFDNHTQAIGPEHVMASGALPPGFPAMKIDGEFYWDGGLVSNTPLDWVLGECNERRDTLAFQVDLWNARGQIPRDLLDVAVRQKEIQFSSRTRASTDRFIQMRRYRRKLASLFGKIPPESLTAEQADFFREEADPAVYNIVHLIYRAQKHGREYSDYEFSRETMEAHWKAGYDHAAHSLRSPRILKRPTNGDGVAVFDLWREKGEPAPGKP
ncbi:MAG: patatin-like phospholipase family protein [Caulobacteraceae bacterium]|nr:patatin-like phospholipase family protein [Caulobacteraceae bacterium]